MGIGAEQPRALRTAVVSKCATCARACTPASVRPAHTSATGAAATRASAASIAACTLRACDWVCQPL
jgi:hypothetical protein